MLESTIQPLPSSRYLIENETNDVNFRYEVVSLFVIVLKTERFVRTETYRNYRFSNGLRPVLWV